MLVLGLKNSNWKSTLFKQMRREKVVPKRLGKLHKGINSDIEPFMEIEDQAITKLIKETAVCKESAFSKASGL